MMDEETRDLWVLALRSGQYRQGRHRLVTESYTSSGSTQLSYCCLGVLCTFKGWIDNSVGGSGGGLNDGPEQLIGNGEIGPEQEVGESGLTYAQRQLLANMNDDSEYTFAEIADWIETNL